MFNGQSSIPLLETPPTGHQRASGCNYRCMRLNNRPFYAMRWSRAMDDQARCQGLNHSRLSQSPANLGSVCYGDFKEGFHVLVWKSYARGAIPYNIKNFQLSIQPVADCPTKCTIVVPIEHDGHSFNRRRYARGQGKARDGLGADLPPASWTNRHTWWRYLLPVGTGGPLLNPLSPGNSRTLRLVA